VHALALAARTARGEWILATDADVVFDPALLRLAMRCARREGAQLLSLVPELVFGSSVETVVMAAFSFLLFTLYPIRLVNNPNSARAIAAGAFLLMRRDDFRSLGGYERLRATVVEDLRMAELFKRNGRRIYVAFTRGLFRTRMYRSVREMWEGLTRSAFEGAGFSITKVLAGAACGVLFTVLPWVAAFTLLIHDIYLKQWPQRDSTLLLAIAACSMIFLVYSGFLIAIRTSPLYVFTLPAATLFYTAAALNSAWNSRFGQGVPWKGRRYRPEGTNRKR
jgi:chlorobactene glucosyltransferase